MKETDHSIVTIDCHYLRPRFAAAFLLIENGRAAFIENNTSLAVPYLLKALKDHNLKPEQVDYLLVTHAHLDHAGGTSALLDHCKNARVVAHPKAARTLINPDKLIRSAEKVYGEDVFRKLYGEIKPVLETQMVSVKDGDSLVFGERTFTFFYTLGHASHHICIHDSKTQSIFTGDALGLCYPDLQGSGLFIFPSTSPIDYDPIEAKKSVEKIFSMNPTGLFLTHFGEISALPTVKKQLLRHLEIHEELFQWARENLHLGDALSTKLEEKLYLAFPTHREFLKLDLELNAQGIAFAASRSLKS